MKKFCFCLILFSSFVFACKWDRDTLNDELQIKKNETLFSLISGQFPHHGDVYYQARIKECLEALAKKSDDWLMRNDLAVAYLATKDYKKALAEFKKLEKQKPNEYKILSNMGVLFKKMGDFNAAIEYTKRALKIKPEGHLGLGDYYLKMLQWRKQVATSSQPPSKNFLGKPYDVGKAGGLSIYSSRKMIENADYEKAKAMVRADQSFADGYVLLGDFLCIEKGNLNLALWAFTRAKMLGHPNLKIIDIRIKAIHSHWEEGKVSFEYTATIEEYLKMCSKWLTKFQETEAALVKQNKKVDFEMVETELKKKEIKRFQPPKPSKNSATDNLITFIVIALIVLVIVFGFVIQKIARFLYGSKSKESVS